MPDHAKAKAVIFVYMAGGPSHLETFDPKPLLNKLDGQKRPAEFGDVQVSERQLAIANYSAEAHIQEVRSSRASKYRIFSRISPKSLTISASFAPCTATWWSTPRRSIR